MKSPNQKIKRAEEFYVPEIRFLGEQDGPPEQILKRRLTDCFSGDVNIIRAYLARAWLAGAPGRTTVVLGLRTNAGPDHRIVNEVQSVFGSVFGYAEHVDIMFLTDVEEAEVAKVCQPFFEQGNTDGIPRCT